MNNLTVYSFKIFIALSVSLIVLFVSSTTSFAQSASSISVSPASHDYGNAAVGVEIKSQTFEIHNTGSTNLTVYAMRVVGADAADFWLFTNGWPITLAPDDRTTIFVSFNPSSEQPKNATLQMIHSAQSNGTLDIPLTGTGVGIETLGQISAGISAETATPGATINVSIVIDMTQANPPADVLQAHQATLTWDPNVLEYAGVAPSITVSSVRDSINGGFVEWYAFDSVGGTGQVVAVTFQFRVDGNIGDSTPLDLEFSLLEANDTENILPILTTFDSSIQVTGPMPPPEIEVTPSSHNYDHVSVGGQSLQPFRVENLGGDNLIIHATTLMSGTVDQFTIQSGGAPFTLSAGQSQDIQVSFDPTTVGAKNAVLRIESNDSDESQINVDLTGEGVAIPVPDITLTPASHDFAPLFVNSSASYTFVVSNQGTADLVVDGTSIVGQDASQLSIVSGGGSFTVVPGVTHDVVVSIHPDGPGFIEADLRFSNNDPGENPLDVPLTGMGLVTPDIDVTPLTLDFGTVNLGEKKTQSLFVNNNGSVAMSLVATGFEGQHENQFSFDMTSSTLIQAGDTETISLNYSPNSAGLKSGLYVIVSDDPDEFPVEVTLTGNGVPVPTILATPASHDFGGLTIGTTSSQVISVRNVGTADLTVQVPTLIGANATEFSLNGGTSAFTLTFGESRDFVVHFNPVTVGAKSAAVRFTNNDPGQGILDVPLTGDGIDLPPAAPSNLTAQATSDTNINLSWIDQSDNEDGFRLERKTGSGSFAEIATIGVDRTVFVDWGLTADTTYTYRMRAYNAGGNSAYSNEASATTQSVPTGPRLHVQSIDVIHQTVFGTITRGVATVRIVDQNDASVSGAAVTGTWSGGANGTDQVTTDGNGEATFESGLLLGQPSITLCVDNVTKSGAIYDSNANVMTCGSTVSSSALPINNMYLPLINNNE